MLTLLQTIAPEVLQKVEKVSADTLATKTVEVISAIKESPNEFLQSLGRDAIHFGLKVLAALVIYMVGAWLISLIRKLVKRSFRRRKTEATVATFVDSLINIGLWVLLIIVTVSALGVNTTSLAALLAAGGMAIGMALSGTVQNFAGGIMLLIFKPFKVGDFIDAQGFSGIVKAVSIVSTRLRTTDNREIILPNGALSNGNITNVTASHLRRVDIPVSVCYGADAEAVKKAILEIVAKQALFLDAKTEGAADPFVGLKELNASSVDFIVRAWVNAPDYWDAYFWLNEAIYTELPAKYGIQFPFPQLDVHIKNN